MQREKNWHAICKNTKKKPTKGRKKKGKNGEVRVLQEQTDGSQESNEENAEESKDKEESNEEPNKIERNKASTDKTTDKTENGIEKESIDEEASILKEESIEEEALIWKKFNIPHSLRDKDLIPDLEKINKNNWISFSFKTLGMSRKRL